MPGSAAAGGRLPAPDGLRVGAALVWTLIAFGSAPSVATATVIGYRVPADWVPLVMSALVRAEIA